MACRRRQAALASHVRRDRQREDVWSFFNPTKLREQNFADRNQAVRQDFREDSAALIIRFLEFRFAGGCRWDVARPGDVGAATAHVTNTKFAVQEGIDIIDIDTFVASLPLLNSSTSRGFSILRIMSSDRISQMCFAEAD